MAGKAADAPNRPGNLKARRPIPREAIFVSISSSDNEDVSQPRKLLKKKGKDHAVHSPDTSTLKAHDLAELKTLDSVKNRRGSPLQIDLTPKERQTNNDLRSHSPPVLPVQSRQARTPHSFPLGEPMDIDDSPVNVEPRDNPLDSALAKVLEVIPDVTPDYARMMCERFIPEFGQSAFVHVLNNLFEDPAYPKVESRKRKRPAEEGSEKENFKEAKIDYGSSSRPFTGGPHYNTLAVELLAEAFPRIPLPYIKRNFQQHTFFAVTYIRLNADSKLDPLPFKPKVSAYRNKGKSRALSDDEIDKEKAWLTEKLASEQPTNTNATASQTHSVAGASDAGIECGCCFGEYPWEQMVQCPDTHLFCTECARRAAEETIGRRNVDLCCMDQSGCKEAFSISEVRRFLPAKTFDLWERIKQDTAIKQAGIEGLESCPYCHYSIIIENEQEKLFHCQNEDCGAVSCRKCKAPDHLPKSCEEIAADKKLDARHVIEEAMTAALTRQCPKCNQSFIKTEGCNKMMCPSCHTTSCYMCRQVITGYDHFGHPPPYTGVHNPGKCQLWDAVEKRGHDEVAAAARAALEKYKHDNPSATDADIDINSILPGPSNNASNLNGARVPFLVAPRYPMPARQVIHRPPPVHNLVARHVQAILQVQEIQPQAQQLAGRMRAARAEAVVRHAAQFARVRPPLLNPANYAVAFEANQGNPLAQGIPGPPPALHGPLARNPDIHDQVNWVQGAAAAPPPQFLPLPLPPRPPRDRGR